MPRYIGAYRGGMRPSAPTTVYRTCALSLPCHSEPVTDVTGVGIRPPFYASGGPWPPPTFAASRQRRDLIIAQTLRVGLPKGRAAALPFGRFKERGFLRKGGNRNPPFLKWRFWLLLSLLTKVTRRRQKRKSERKTNGRGRAVRPYAHLRKHPARGKTPLSTSFFQKNVVY